MASSPRYKIYDSHGTYQAACKEIEAAAALMGFYGDGATIRDGHNRIVWTEGKDGAAGDSYDHVAWQVNAKPRRKRRRIGRWARPPVETPAVLRKLPLKPPESR